MYSQSRSRLDFMPMHCMHRSAADPETFQTGAVPWPGGLGRQTEGGGGVRTFWEHFLFIHDINM